jgi:hypothetical protein
MIHAKIGITNNVSAPTTPDAYIPRDSPDVFVLIE